MPESYHHVTPDVRSQIFVLKANNFSLRTIAKNVGFNVSTISREIARNKEGNDYHYLLAQTKTIERRICASTAPRKLIPELMALLKERLMQGWSPEQISGRLALDGMNISHETIYRYIRSDKKKGGILYTYLRHRGKKYNKRLLGKAGRGCIPERRDITERPKIVEEKARIGDWEGDTIIGAKHQGAIVSYVDRHSKYVLLKKVDYKTAALVHQATIGKMLSLPHPIHSITYDNGKEFSNHVLTALALKTVCYFATPYHSWERGLNEHTNGLVREYLPKSTDFTQITDEQVQAIEDILNARPRKALGYRTPAEVFFSEKYSLG